MGEDSFQWGVEDSKSDCAGGGVVGTFMALTVSDEAVVCRARWFSACSKKIRSVLPARYNEVVGIRIAGTT